MAKSLQIWLVNRCCGNKVLIGNVYLRVLKCCFGVLVLVFGVLIH